MIDIFPISYNVVVLRQLDINIQSSKGKTPLHIAAKYNSLEVAQILLDHGAIIDAKDTDSFTQLHDAEKIGNELLNRMSSLTKALNKDLILPLHLACLREKLKISLLQISKTVTTSINA
ncbi:Tankyrase-2 [Trichoplax sp. H2]|nr:Tankyrase-2 [Trichoplax sp. H2]|eukprot:RDD38682.1 Tankyrase-2 [Trichoplax sp. H2]